MSTNHLLRAVLGTVLCVFALGGQAWAQSPFLRGDIDCDGDHDNDDVAAFQTWIFGGGMPPPCPDAADLNDNGQIDITDLTHLVNFVTTGVPPPAPPYPNCGYDPTLDGIICPTSCCGVARDHFQVWRLSPPPVSISAQVTDQFMTDVLQLTRIEFLANPAQKDSFLILNPDDHLTWYSAFGRDTLLTIEFYNQFGLDTVQIGSVSHLILPTQKLPHPAPRPELDHYKAYRILNPVTFIRVTTLFDQFFPTPWTVDQLTPLYFLTPASKNGEPIFDSVVHYVAYDFIPKRTFGTVRQTVDQFGPHTLQTFNSELLMVPTYKLHVRPPDEPTDTLKNHFKTWRVNPPQPFTGLATTVDQFYDHQVFLQGLEYLSNPCIKDTSGIKRPDDHLNWYRAVSQQPTLTLRVEFDNQFQRDTIHIGPLTHLLVPCRKDPHPAPDSLLGHYTAYQILDPATYRRPGGAFIQIQDQFDVLGPEFIDSVVQRYFLTPAQKNNEPMFGSDTHYVAYEIYPKSPGTAGMVRTTADQFGVWQLPIGNSELLLVPPHKITWGPPQDSAKNHYKSWRLEPIPFLATVDVVDQFMTDVMRLDTIDYLSNPAQKDTHPIERPDDHLLWYGATGKNTCLRVVYDNQFGLDTFVIGQASYLLVPAQKLPHPPPDPTQIDHYKAYRVRNPQSFTRVTQIMDQFDPIPEVVDVLTPVYFLTPASKNGEGINDSSTHYVAYDFVPKDPMINTRTVIDQFGQHLAITRHSELLLVPTRKLQWNYNCILTQPGNLNCDAAVTSADIIHLVNYVFKGGLPPCPCIAAGDINCDGAITSADIILLVNYIFKGGPPPCDPCTIIPSLWECPC